MRLKATTAIASILLLTPHTGYSAAPPLFPDFDIAKQAYKNKNYSKAASHWMPLAHKGDANAQVELGKLYSKGLGVKQNHGTALNLFMSAADKNNARGMYELGRAYERGNGITKSPEKAKEWYQLAASNGYARGHSSIGDLYTKNKLNQPKAVLPQTKSTIKDNVNAIKDGDYSQAESLGDLYQQGIHVPTSYSKALTYFMVADRNGSPTARQKSNFVRTKVSMDQVLQSERQASLILSGKDKLVREERREVIRSLKRINKPQPTPQEIQANETIALKHYERAVDYGYTPAEEKIAIIKDVDISTIKTPPKPPKKKYKFVTSIKAQVTAQENLDLGTRDDDLETAVSLDGISGVYLYPTDNITSYIEARGVLSEGIATTDTDDDDNTADASFLELRQAWVNFDKLLGVDPLALKVGRQRFYEPRGLWWNRDLDAARLAMETSLTNGFVAVGENLSKYRIGDDDELERDEEDRLRILGELSHNYTKNHFIEARFLFEDDHSGTADIGQTIPANDRDNEDNKLTWVGLRAKGMVTPPATPIQLIGYRADVLGVGGSEETVSTVSNANQALRTVSAVNERDVLGWAFDGSVDFLIDHYLEPTITVGYAYGSGDDGTGDNSAFRQNGLDGNTSRFPDERTSNSLRNYGEVLRPELSNIHIANLGLNVPVLKASDVNVNYFSYWLDDTATGLRSSSISAPVNGQDNHLGQAMDFAANINVGKETRTTNPLLKKSTIRFRLGGFKAGDAYGMADDEYSYRGSTELRVKF